MNDTKAIEYTSLPLQKNPTFFRYRMGWVFSHTGPLVSFASRGGRYP